MAKQRESRRQRKIRQALEKEVGGYWWKQHGGPFTPAGLPDLIGCCESLFFGIEVKEPDSDEPDGSDIQQSTAKRIRTEGKGSTLLGCLTPEEAVTFVKTILDERGIVLAITKRTQKDLPISKAGSAPRRRRRVGSRKT